MKHTLILIIICTMLSLSACAKKVEENKLSPRDTPSQLDTPTATNTSGARP